MLIFCQAILTKPVLAQVRVATGETIESLRDKTTECVACRAAADSLREIRVELFQQADLIATDRVTARTNGDAAAERQLLARGQVVSEAIQYLSETLAVKEKDCARALDLLAAALSDSRSGADRPFFAILDSLQREYNRLTRNPVMRLSQLVPPRIHPDDTPETLRRKADFTQDLVDRIERWRASIAAEKQRLEDQQRIGAEVSNLLGDELFLDPGASGDIFGGGDPIAWSEFEGELSVSLSGMIAELISEFAGNYEEATAEEILTLTDEWLKSKFTELVNLTQHLELMARRREMEP